MINVLLFAELQEQAGCDRLELETNESLTVEKLKKLLESRFSFSLNSVMVAINEEYARDDDQINKGDTVALIPPVSGG